MFLKKQFIYFKMVIKLAKQKKIEVKSNILTKDISILLKIKSIKGLLVLEKNIAKYRNLK